MKLNHSIMTAYFQLEEMEKTKSQLEKANARLDDLQAQVNAKNLIERQLSIEKSQLEMSVDSSNKAVERMSQNVEELQWRIRNNFDLPVQVWFPNFGALLARGSWRNQQAPAQCQTRICISLCQVTGGEVVKGGSQSLTTSPVSPVSPSQHM